MNCFYHHESAAVGICKNCQRGLCPACAAEVANGLACKGRCEPQVSLISEMIERSANDSKIGRSALRSSGTTYISVGIAMGLLAALWQVLISQLHYVSIELPAAKYLSIPFWLMAAIMVLAGIAQRKKT